MKKNPKDYTAGEAEYLKRKAAAKAGKPQSLAFEIGG